MDATNTPFATKRVTFAEPTSNLPIDAPSATPSHHESVEADDRHPAAADHHASGREASHGEDEAFHTEDEPDPTHDTIWTRTITINAEGLKDGITVIEGKTAGIKAKRGAGVHALLCCETMAELAKEALKEFEENKQALADEGKDIGLLEYQLQGCLACSQASTLALEKSLKRPGEGDGGGWSSCGWGMQ